jgi:hypothetical protein
MRVSRPEAGGPDLEAGALAEADLAVALEEVQAAVAAGMAPAGDMALEAAEQVLVAEVAMDLAEVGRARGMGLAAHLGPEVEAGTDPVAVVEV